MKQPITFRINALNCLFSGFSEPTQNLIASSTKSELAEVPGLIEHFDAQRLGLRREASAVPSCCTNPRTFYGFNVCGLYRDSYFSGTFIFEHCLGVYIAINRHS